MNNDSSSPAPAVRLDAALAARQLARSRSHAATLISDGLVSVDGQVVVKSAFKVRDDQDITVEGDTGYVSRAAGKLLAALNAFDDVDLIDAVVLDAGASTGGFTQVALERGARRVVAVDVGHDQLDSLLRDDPRVSVVEGFNIRFATPANLAAVSGITEEASVVVGDLSFISLLHVLPALCEVAAPGADFVLLVKPQFEVGRTGVKEGIVKNPALRADAVAAVAWAAHDLKLGVAGLIPSPVIGSTGNKEYLIWLSQRRGSNPTEWIDTINRITGA